MKSDREETYRGGDIWRERDKERERERERDK